MTKCLTFEMFLNHILKPVSPTYFLHGFLYTHLITHYSQLTIHNHPFIYYFMLI